MKKIIRLRESELRHMIAESVKRVLNEKRAIRESQEYDIDSIISELEDSKEYYDLSGVEITEEDAQNVISLMQSGMPMDDAVSEVLEGIRDVVSQGWDF
jgi:hypothetical protein